MRTERGTGSRRAQVGGFNGWRAARAVGAAGGAMFAVLLGTGMLAAQESPLPRYEVRRATSPIVIDGVIDDAAWSNASTPATLQGLWTNQTGIMQSTAVRLLWDDENLYVSYDVEDVDITAVFENRDDPTYRDDAVEIFINPMPDQVDIYVGLEMNARGVLFDYIMYDARQTIKQLDLKGVEIATHLRGTLNQREDQDQGWSLEVVIPWHNFSDWGPRPRAGTVWRANLNRWDGVPPDRRMSIWSDPQNDRSWPHAPERFGELVFVD